MKIIWLISTGPYYRCVDQDNNPILDVHLDLVSAAWRVSYASGYSIKYFGIESAKQEVRNYFKGRGVNSLNLDFMCD